MINETKLFNFFYEEGLKNKRKISCPAPPRDWGNEGINWMFQHEKNEYLNKPIGELKVYGEHLMDIHLEIVYILTETQNGDCIVVYVGSAKNSETFNNRLQCHHRTKSFDKVLFYEVPLGEKNDKECELIRDYLPRYNKCSCSKKADNELVEQVGRGVRKIIADPLNSINVVNKSKYS